MSPYDIDRLSVWLNFTGNMKALYTYGRYSEWDLPSALVATLSTEPFS